MIEDLVFKNRSYRAYDESHLISKAELISMVEFSRICSSGMNLQPLRYYITVEKEEVCKIQEITKWAAALKEYTLPAPGHYPTAYIVICCDKNVVPNPDMAKTDLGITAQTILLKATEMDLGGCMIGNFNADKMKAILQLKEQYHPMLAVAIGKPDEQIVLTEVNRDGKTSYYLDELGIHYVPKRKMEDILL